MTCGTCGDIVKLLKAATGTPWSPEERAAIVQRSEQSLRETTAIMAQRERDRLLKMKPATRMIQ